MVISGESRCGVLGVLIWSAYESCEEGYFACRIRRARPKRQEDWLRLCQCDDGDDDWETLMTTTEPGPGRETL